MKLTAYIKLLPTKKQAELLLATIKEANTASNSLSDYAWESKIFKQYDLHRERYYILKDSFELSSQMIVRVISKVADSYKLDKESKRIFRLTGAVAYDSRILTYNTAKTKPGRRAVSIWTKEGRQKINYIAGEHGDRLLTYQKGESDLLYTNRGAGAGKFFLLATCEIPDEQPQTPEDILGVDFGIIQIATDSDGQSFSGAGIEQSRQWYAKRRATLQSVGTKSAKRKLKKLSGKQKNFQTHTNHVISKQLVTKAKGTNRAIAIEELTHIRNRTEKRLRKAQRSKHSNWSFNQLRQFLDYKSTLYSVALILVDPRNTSRTCSVCSHCEKANRKSQAEFVCRSCGHSANADFNASQNIKSLGYVNKPLVSVKPLA